MKPSRAAADVSPVTPIAIEISGFPFPLDKARLAVAFDGELGSLAYEPEKNSIRTATIWILPPKHKAGIVNVTVVFFVEGCATCNSSVPAPQAEWNFVYFPQAWKLTCQVGCEAAADGTAPALQIAVLRLTGPGPLSVTDVRRIDCLTAIIFNGSSAGFCRVLRFWSTPCITATPGAPACMEVRVEYAASASLLAASRASALAAGDEVAAASSVVLSGSGVYPALLTIFCGNAEACGGGHGSGLVADIAFRKAPRVVAAFMENSFAGLSIVLDGILRSVDGDSGWEGWCALLPTTSSLGLQPRCFWTGPTTGRLAFGSNSSLLPGDTLTLPGWATTPEGDDAADASEAVRQTVLVGAALAPSIPRIWVSGPSLDGASCADASMQAETAAALPAFEWGCSNDPFIDDFISASFDADTSTSKELKAEADSASSMQHSNEKSSLMVSPGVLSPAARYIVTAKVWSQAAGLYSDAATTDLSIGVAADGGGNGGGAVLLPPMTAKIALSPPPFYRPSIETVVGTGAACASKNAASTAILAWTLYSSSNSADITLSDALKTFQVCSSPKFNGRYLVAQRSYLVQLTVALPQTVNWVRRSILVASSQIYAAITGGSRTVGRNTRVVLDGSASFDPDACMAAVESNNAAAVASQCAAAGIDGLVFSWSCSLPCDGGPCRYVSSQSMVNFPMAAVIEIDLHQLYLPDAVTNVVVSLSVSRIAIESSLSSLNSTTSILLDFADSNKTKDDSTLTVGILVSSVDASRAVYSATYSGNALSGNDRDVKLRWGLRPSVLGTCPPSRSAASLAAATSYFVQVGPGELNVTDPTAFPAGRTGANFVVNLGSAWATANLRPGGAYDLTLSVSGAGVMGGIRSEAASVLLRMPLPPVPGVCSSQPLTGPALSNFVISCAGWMTSNPPLSYSFAVVNSDVGGSDRNISWLAPRSAPFLDVALAMAGSYFFYIKVIDNQVCQRIPLY